MLPPALLYNRLYGFSFTFRNSPHRTPIFLSVPPPPDPPGCHEHSPTLAALPCFSAARDLVRLHSSRPAFPAHLYIASSASMACQCSIRRWVRGNVIGAGSFGKVNLAINVSKGELFAVKSIDCSNGGSAAVAAMENELKFLQSFDSPFIVRCFGGDQTLENGVQMRNLFMEYMAGGSLVDLMRRFGGALDETLIRVYTRGILAGLNYLHGQGVVHCDVKGKNILIGASGVKIADLGSAKRLGQQVEAVMRGTPLWMAPEVIMQVEQGPPSDIWSLGCTVVEMATGRPPWSQHGLNLFAALLQIGGKEDVPPFPDCLSAEGKDFLSKCLHRDPAQRWTSAQLLKHPFVREGGEENCEKVHGFCGQEDEAMKVPLSPTSVLDVGTSTWDTREPPCISVPFLHRPEADKTGSMASCNSSSSSAADSCAGAHEEEESSGRWITVRSPCQWGEERQRPLSDFMLGRELQWVGRGNSELNLQSLHFLRARRPTTPSPGHHHIIRSVISQPASQPPGGGSQL